MSTMIQTTAVILLTAELVRDLYLDAIGRLRVRLAFLDAESHYMTTVESDDEDRRYHRSETLVTPDNVIGWVHHAMGVYVPSCDCTERDIWGECHHGNSEFAFRKRRSDWKAAHLMVADRIGEIDAIVDRHSLFSWLQDGYDPQGYVHVIHFETENDRIKRERDERREELEQAASAFAKANYVRPGSFDFIAKLIEAIASSEAKQEHYNSYEVRAEEYMDHLHAGCRETYWENRDYTSSKLAERTDTLRDILYWLDETCPLLMASYREQYGMNV